MRTVAFYRFTAIQNGSLVWQRVAEYPLQGAPDNATAVQLAANRFREEHGVDWKEAADTYTVRRSYSVAYAEGLGLPTVA